MVKVYLIPIVMQVLYQLHFPLYAKSFYFEEAQIMVFINLLI